MDAPLIAVLWQDVFAGDAGVRLSAASRVALPMAVWLIYLVDRLLDTAADLPAQTTARHQFYYLHRNVAYLLAGVVACVSTTSLTHLPAAVLKGGLVVSCMVRLYLLMIHSMGGQWRRWLPKEAVVGLVFPVAPCWRRLRGPRMREGWCSLPCCSACCAG